MVQVQVTDSAAQTEAVMKAKALQAEMGGHSATVNPERWHAAASWLSLEGERWVRVPYASVLVAPIPKEEVRMRRDFTQVLSFVEAHAFLHQRSRERDEDGAVLANRDDYAAAYRLLGSALAVTMNSVTDAERETVEAVQRPSRSATTWRRNGR